MGVVGRGKDLGIDAPQVGLGQRGEAALRRLGQLDFIPSRFRPGFATAALLAHL